MQFVLGPSLIITIIIMITIIIIIYFILKRDKGVFRTERRYKPQLSLCEIKQNT